jgi:hypothetical protein
MASLISGLFENKQLEKVTSSSSFKKTFSFILKYGPIFATMYLTYFLWYNWHFLIALPLLSYKKCMFCYLMMNLFQTQNLNGEVNEDENKKCREELYKFLELNYIDKPDYKDIILYENFTKLKNKQINDFNENYIKGNYYEMFKNIYSFYSSTNF